jgi:hypothetical protein
MTDEHHQTEPTNEAQAIAALLGCQPSELWAVKMDSTDGGGSLPEDAPPPLSGFGAPAKITVSFKGDYPWERDAVRYDSGKGSLVVVGHETGATIWTVAEHTALVMSIFGLSLRDLFKWIRARPGARPAKEPAKVRQFDDAGKPYDQETDFDETMVV